MLLSSKYHKRIKLQSLIGSQYKQAAPKFVSFVGINAMCRTIRVKSRTGEFSLTRPSLARHVFEFAKQEASTAVKCRRSHTEKNAHTSTSAPGSRLSYRVCQSCAAEGTPTGGRGEPTTSWCAAAADTSEQLDPHAGSPRRVEVARVRAAPQHRCSH